MGKEMEKENEFEGEKKKMAVGKERRKSGEREKDKIVAKNKLLKKWSIKYTIG